MATVLVVENDGGVRSALCDLLFEYDHKPVGVSDGPAALAAIDKGLRPDVIVIDLAIPDKDMRAFRERQLSQPNLANIPIVVITASENQPADTSGLVHHGLTRPIPSDVLMSLIREFSARPALAK